MEKPARSKGKLLSFLSKATSVAFQNPPFSPSQDKRQENSSKVKANAAKGFSGPIISIIPAEARRRSKNGSFDAQEPTSPKVSCMGQIKHKKKISKSKRVSPPQESKLVSSPLEAKKKPSSMIRKIFHGAKPGNESDAFDKKPPLDDRSTSLIHMKRFASGRGAFADFDWTTHVSVGSDHRNYYSDEEREESEEEDEVIIPHSAPIIVGGAVALEPRKEVNLWKRRTMAPPRPLQLNKMSQLK